MSGSIDIMTSPSPRPSRWDRDGEGAIVALAAQLDAAGLPGELAASRRWLARGEELAGEARRGRGAAQVRWQSATDALLAGGIDADGLAAVARETAVWLDWSPDQGRAAPLMAALMTAAATCRGRATAVAIAETSGLYGKLAATAAEVVAAVAAVPVLPAGVWSATSTGAASSIAINAGLEDAWATLVRQSARWDAVHSAAELVRDSGGLGQQALMFEAGCPVAIGCMFLGWEAALEGMPAVRRLPGPLRVRAAVDRGWRPGLYTAQDHVADAAKPRRSGLLAGLRGG